MFANAWVTNNDPLHIRAIRIYCKMYANARVTNNDSLHIRATRIYCKMYVNAWVTNNDPLHIWAIRIYCKMHDKNKERDILQQRIDNDIWNICTLCTGYVLRSPPWPLWNKTVTIMVVTEKAVTTMTVTGKTVSTMTVTEYICHKWPRICFT